MKNNKGYYHWIHALNQTASQNQMRADKILTEAKAVKITDKAKLEKLGQQLMPIAPVEHGKPNIDPAAVRMFGQQLARTGPVTKQSITLAGGDAGAFINLQQIKAAQTAADIAKAEGPIDAKPVGNAQDIEDDAQDGVLEDPPLTQLPSYNLAAQAREETAKEDEEKDWEEREEARLLSDYSGRSGEVKYESVTKKINNFLKL